MNLYKIKYFISLIILFLSGCELNRGILAPKGIVAFQERAILFNSTAIMSMVVLTVIVMSIIFVYHYRETNNKVEYKPNWCHSVFLESIWWGVPCLIILILSVYTWVTTHKLDPYRRLNYPGNVINIQVVALPWKWLFIYPDTGIASVNKIVIPKDRQVEFHLTTDNVPMSAFFIPQLGSQIYTMAGMRTKLHIIPSYLGVFEGFNAQYNGVGFSNMSFTVEVVLEENFEKWQNDLAINNPELSLEEYNIIRAPSQNNAVKYYNRTDKSLFNTIIHSYMTSGIHPKQLSKMEI